MGSHADGPLSLGDKTFSSRLFVGTGKYRSHAEMARCHEASGAEIVTVAVRRVNLTDKSKESLLDYIDRSRIFILPNTAGCYNADEAIRAARLAREVGLSHWVKLEVIGDEKTLFPDNQGLIEATRVLAKEGFVVLPYTNDDLVNARRLIDAGVGTASDAAVAMELGYDGVLMNTAIAEADDPPLMARAMKLAVEAGRAAYRAGRMPKKLYASASSPLAGVVR